MLLGLASYYGYYIVFRRNTTRIKRRVVSRYGEIGPYPVTVLDDLLREKQERLIDATRENYDYQLFPMDFINGAPFRFNDNGHGISGSARDAARRTINTTVRSYGYETYEISPAIQSDPDASTHRHFAPADLRRPYSTDDITNNHVIVGIDIDYYIEDMEDWIGLCRPMIFYTFNPVAVSGKDGDSFFPDRG